jgi:hypothetical protein
MNAVLLLCALIGATLVVVRGTICRPIQARWPALFRCSQCTGMWVGIVAGGAGIVSVGRGRMIDAVVVGFATSFLAMAADAMLIKLLGDPGEEKKS